MQNAEVGLESNPIYRFAVVTEVPCSNVDFYVIFFCANPKVFHEFKLRRYIPNNADF